MTDIKNKKVLITGATGGLGQALIARLKNERCKLYVTGRNKQKLIKLKKEYDVVDFVDGDLNDLEFTESIPSIFPDIDILINNAGVFPLKNILNSDVKDYETCFNVNVRAPFILSTKYGAMMKSKSWGRIVNIGSSSAYNGDKDSGLYCASKHAILGLSRSLFLELRGTGVRTYCISPGSMQTDMGKTDKRQDYSTFIKPDEIVDFIVYTIKFDSEMIPEEVRLNRMIDK
ncbi:MAG: SDR family oxidoreductase [Candidatus Marinimicrobia bacterium]|nr:SDR family oxidoreductase [Candidatus Neomarinimicrobiota bacterium]